MEWNWGVEISTLLWMGLLNVLTDPRDLDIPGIKFWTASNGAGELASDSDNALLYGSGINVYRLFHG